MIYFNNECTQKALSLVLHLVILKSKTDYKSVYKKNASDNMHDDEIYTAHSTQRYSLILKVKKYDTHI